MPDDPSPPTYFGAPPRSLSAGASVLTRMTARVRMFTGFAVRSTRAWLRAARELAALKLERRRLERTRKALQYELGSAALVEDERLVEDLRARLRICIGEQEHNETRARAAVAGARARTSEERSAVARTEIRPPV